MGFQPVWASLTGSGRRLPTIDVHPAFERMVSRMPAASRATFTPEQMAVLSQISKPPPTRHWIDYRVSLPFFGGRYYLTLLFGKERRLLSRIKSEGQASVTKTSIVYVAILWFLITIGLISGILFLYLVKSAFGLDLFSGPSVLHDFAHIDPLRH